MRGGLAIVPHPIVLLIKRLFNQVRLGRWGALDEGTLSSLTSVTALDLGPLRRPLLFERPER